MNDQAHLPGIDPRAWHRSAELSPDGVYRYTLVRVKRGVGPLDLCGALFIGLNPSTADHRLDDQTVRKWMGFTERWGMPGFTAVNFFGLRSTDPLGLLRVDDPVGPKNFATIAREAERAARIIVCWGDGKPKLAEWIARQRVVLAPIFAHRQCFSFGLTRKMNPKHVLMIPYDSLVWPYRWLT